MSEGMERLGELAVDLGKLQAAVPQAQENVSNASEKFADLAARKAELEQGELSLDQRIALAEADNFVLAEYIKAAKHYAWRLDSVLEQYATALREIGDAK